MAAGRVKVIGKKTGEKLILGKDNRHCLSLILTGIIN